MLQEVASFLTEFMYKKGAITSSKRPIFVYGFQLTLSTLCSLVSITILAAFLHSPLSALMFFIVFFWIRLFAGGFHASSYLRCFFLTNAVYLLVALMSELLVWVSSVYLVISVQILFGAVAFFLTPIRHPNHPLSENIYLRNQKISRFLIVLYELIFPCISFFTGNLAWMSALSASLMAIAILMIIPKIQERRDKHE